jgi:hypothetical protein
MDVSHPSQIETFKLSFVLDIDSHSTDIDLLNYLFDSRREDCHSQRFMETKHTVPE